jgi:AhpD family alkylhydroperoxidase
MSDGRLPLVDADSDDPRLAHVFERFREAGREVPTLYRALGNAPAMLDAWVGLAWPLRNEATTSRALRELIIMRVAQLTRTAYEWVAHRPMTLKYGITESQLAQLHRWWDSTAFDADQREVLAMTDELTNALDVSDETWAALADRYAPGEIVELVLTAAYYSCVSRTLRALRLPVDPDDPALESFWTPS